MDKRRFKRVCLLIVAAVAALVAMQGVWLSGMLRQSARRQGDRIASAVSTALYRSRLSGHASYDMKVSGAAGDSLTVLRLDPATRDTLQKMDIMMNAASADGRRSVGMYVMNFDRPNLRAVDSLVKEELAACGVRSYDLYVAACGGAERRFSHSADSLPPHGNSGRYMTVEQEYDMTGRSGGTRLSVRVVTEHPYGPVLREMRGVIVSSVLILALVAAAFAYLLRTLFRFKSVERMRMDLTHNITHELKTPIAVACAAGDSLLNFEQLASDPAVRREYLGIMQRELRQLASMVDRILSMSVEESDAFVLSPQECDAAEAVAEAVEAQRLRTHKRAEFSVETEAGLKLRADRFHLVKALGNLLDNAVKYSGDAVHVRVRAVSDGSDVVFSVADDGRGMARGETERVFDKFYRIPTGDLHEVKGYGLGLYYVRAVAERHGGRVRAESGGAGRGSEFFVILPKNGCE